MHSLIVTLDSAALPPSTPVDPVPPGVPVFPPFCPPPFEPPFGVFGVGVLVGGGLGFGFMDSGSWSRVGGWLVRGEVYGVFGYMGIWGIWGYV